MDASAPVWRLAAISPYLWAAGALLLVGRLAFGFLSLAMLARRGRRLEDPEWIAICEACAKRVGVKSVPRLVVSPSVAMPCTSGWLRPLVLLPEEAVAWDLARREIVLLHELAHIRRHDFLPHLVAQTACAIHWFNPLVWLAAARLRSEAERASDALVVGSGTRPSDYASHLLDIVRGSSTRWHPVSVLPMAHRSEFEGRLLAILESTGGRGMPTRKAALAAGVMVLAFTVPVAAIGASRPSAKAAPFDEIAETASEQVLEQSRDLVRKSEAYTVTRETIDQAITGVTSTQGAIEIETTVALTATLSDPVSSVRQAAAEALGGARDTIAVRALMEALRNDTDAGVRRSAAWALGEIEDARAIPALADALGDADAGVRKHAAWALGQIEEPRAVPALSEALRRDRDVEVRTMAAWALGSIEDPSAVDALTEVLGQGQNPSVRKAAVDALSSIEDARAVPHLLPLLRDPDPIFRRAAAEALGSIEDRGAVDELVAAIRDQHVEVRRAVVDALGSIEDRSAAPALATALSDQDVEVRRKAANALGDLDELAEAPPELIRALQDRDREVRHTAVHALGSLEDPAAVPGLAALLRDPDVELRRAVVSALDDIEGSAASAALREALRDQDPEVRRRAAKALGDRSK